MTWVGNPGLTTLSVADRDPVAVGVNIICKLQVLAGSSVTAQLERKEKSPGFVPPSVNCGERLFCPMLATLAGSWGLEVPTVSDPKAMLDTDTVSDVLGVGRNVIG